MPAILSSCLRKLLVWSLIAQQLLSGSGAVMAVPAAADRSAERYPCEHCRCGCRSAERCWRQCCCFTNRQRVAWARRNGVAVPAFVATAAEREAAVDKNKCPHCSRGVVQQAHRSTSSVCWLDALRCLGMAEFWQTLGASWPGDGNTQLTVELLPLGRIEQRPFLKRPFLSPAPPTPPPKAA